MFPDVHTESLGRLSLVPSLGTHEKSLAPPSLNGLGFGERSITSLCAIWLRTVLQEISLLRLYYQKIIIKDTSVLVCCIG